MYENIRLMLWDFYMFGNCPIRVLLWTHLTHFLHLFGYKPYNVWFIILLTNAIAEDGLSCLDVTGIPLAALGPTQATETHEKKIN